MNHYKETAVSEKQIRNKTLLGILFLVIFMSTVLIGWDRLQDQPKVQGALKPLRKGLEMNEWIFTNFFSNDHISREYNLALAAPKVRVNGDAGLANAADTADWKLNVVRSPGDTVLLSLGEIRSLPKTEIVFDFKCIEGWSQVTHWGGVRFSDFVKHYGLSKQSIMNYAALVTPDGKYYVGIDMASMMHPQTLLCYEMNGKALPLNQGYPLRLIIPVKYGVKHLKRIGVLSFADERPKDYWYEQGYDYYCGL